MGLTIHWGLRSSVRSPKEAREKHDPLGWLLVQAGEYISRPARGGGAVFVTVEEIIWP